MTCKCCHIRCVSTESENVLHFLGHISLLVCLCRTHCNADIMSQKELCDERVATAKLEVEKKMKELSSSLDKSPQVRRHLFIRMAELRKNFFFYKYTFY